MNHLIKDVLLTYWNELIRSHDSMQDIKKKASVNDRAQLAYCDDMLENMESEAQRKVGPPFKVSIAPES